MSALLQPPRIAALLIALALTLAALGARPYAGSWNDGSRLAAVESLLQRGTLSIDDSVFVRPRDAAGRGHPPYPPNEELREKGTQDKLLIAGRYHSDKPPVVSLFMAAVYAPGHRLGLLPSPAERPGLFAWLMALGTSAVAFAVAVFCMYRLGHRAGLNGWAHTTWIGAFALSTFGLAYTRHVNNHVLQLAVVAGWCLLAVEWVRAEDRLARTLLLLGMGTALGFGYNLDLGSGPLCFAAAAGLVAYRARRPGPVLLVVGAALPWIVACHAINHAVGGVLGPLNAVPAYLDWPDSPFSTDNMTGVLRHTPYKLAVYALSLLFGKHGILNHNLPLLLCIPALVAVLRERSPYRPELAAGLLWCAAAWGLYALMSNNWGGACCSVRWFVPFLAPGFFLLAVYLKQRPEQLPAFAALAGWGAVLGLIMWTVGPWPLRMVPGLWPITGCALLSWLAVTLWRPRPKWALTREQARGLTRRRGLARLNGSRPRMSHPCPTSPTAS